MYHKGKINSNATKKGEDHKVRENIAVWRLSGTAQANKFDFAPPTPAYVLSAVLLGILAFKTQVGHFRRRILIDESCLWIWSSLRSKQPNRGGIKRKRNRGWLKGGWTTYFIRILVPYHRSSRLPRWHHHPPIKLEHSKIEKRWHARIHRGEQIILGDVLQVEGRIEWESQIVARSEKENKQKGVVIGEVVATWLIETVRLQSRPRDRVSGALKVHFSEQTRFFEPNSNEKTFSLPLDCLFLGEWELRILMGALHPGRKDS